MNSFFSITKICILTSIVCISSLTSAYSDCEPAYRKKLEIFSELKSSDKLEVQKALDLILEVKKAPEIFSGASLM